MTHTGTAFSPDDVPQRYVELLGFLRLTESAGVPETAHLDNRLHAFVRYGDVSGQGGYMQSLCGAFWWGSTPEQRGHLSTDEAAFLANSVPDRCADCRTQYQRLRASDIPAPVPYVPPAA